MSSPQGTEPKIVLIRHAETEWTISHRHTGRADIPLTDNGRDAARALATTLAGRSFGAVLVSPSLRARETCELAGLGAQATLNADLLEWDYGEYEGLTRDEIEARRPDWQLWRDGCPGGELLADVGARADRVILAATTLPGPVALFSHGHLLRVLGARWAPSRAAVWVSPPAPCACSPMSTEPESWHAGTTSPATRSPEMVARADV